MTTCCTITESIRDTSPFQAGEAGCLADGAFGDHHVTAKCVRLAHQFGMPLNDYGHWLLGEADNNNGRDFDLGDVEEWRELTDESEAWLNQYAVEDGLVIHFFEGDLRLDFIEGDE